MYAFDYWHKVKQQTWPPLTSSKYDEKHARCQYLCCVYWWMPRKLNTAGWEVPCCQTSWSCRSESVNIDPPGSYTPYLFNKLTDAAWCFYQALHIIKLLSLILLNVPVLWLPAVLISSSPQSLQAIKQLSVGEYKSTVTLLFGHVTEVNVWMNTFIFLILWRLQQLDKLHIDVKLNCNDEGNFQQDQLQLLNAYQTQRHTLMFAYMCKTLPDFVFCVMLSWQRWEQTSSSSPQFCLC